MENKKNDSSPPNKSNNMTPEHVPDIFPVRLCARMEEENIGTSELADALYITPSAVSAYRSGRRTPDLRILTGLCEILHTSSDYLLGLSDDPHAETVPADSDSDESLLRLFHSLDSGNQSAAQSLIFNLKRSQVSQKKDK